MRRVLLMIVVSCLFSCKKGQDSKPLSNYLFKEISQEHTGLDFVNQLKEDVDHSIINYIYFYNGAGVAVGDVNNDNLPDIYFVSNQGDNQLYLNKGDLKFENITVSAGVGGQSSWNTGATMVDVNGDGYMDIYVCAVSGLLDFKGHNELFINNGDGTFDEKSKEYGLDFIGYSTQAYFFDYDKDDDLDVYIVNHAVHTTLSHGSASVRDERVSLIGDVLLNNNDGVFNDVSKAANIYGGVNSYGLSASISDFNNDGWEDIYVCNDFHEDDYYYINNKDGSFSEKLASNFSTISRFSMGSDAADINNDGFFDLVTLDMLPDDERALKETEGDAEMFNMQQRLRTLGYKDQYSRNMLQVNNFGKYFIEKAIYNGISSTDWSWAPLLSDFDNDGYNDLFITNGILRRPNGLDFKKYVSGSFKGRSVEDGLKWLYNSIGEMPNGKAVNRLYRGGVDKFTEKTGVWMNNELSLSNGAIYSDLDLDGDLDLVVNNVNSQVKLYENNSVSNNYLNIKLNYLKGNLEGIGSKVKMYTSKGFQTAMVEKSRGFLSSVEATLHFGLGEVVEVDSLEIFWPNLKVQKIYTPSIDTTLVINYDTTELKNFHENNYLKKKLLFQEENYLNYEHVENSEYDFLENRLLPYRLTMTDPAFAVGDVDQNGFDDIYLGNSSGKKGTLYLNDGAGFTELSNADFDRDLFYEDTAAHIFDADNDGDLDLYVASGIGLSLNNGHNTDRLYINNLGEFTKSKDRIPDFKLNSSIVVSADYDSDGDQDLFVGHRSLPNNFGETVNSYILKNDGNGNFIIDTNFNLKSRVTQATWDDVNSDGKPDLLVSTEWDTPKIYINQNGTFVLKENFQSNMHGLWRAIETYDIDGDGDLDILLGNWGLNTKLSLNDLPIKLYYADLDKNGKTEIITAYTKNGKEYPINTKDEIATQMIAINKLYTTNSDFALKTMSDIFGESNLNNATEYKVNQLASGYLENDKGDFTKFHPFKEPLQLAPINYFSTINYEGLEGVVVVGNSLDVSTFHGGYTSFKGALLKKDGVQQLSELGIEPLNDQVNGVFSVKMKNKNLLFFLINGQQLKEYSHSN